MAVTDPRHAPRQAAVYCRLSYAPDGSLEKVERQEADCRELAARLDWQISEAHVFPDNSRSAWQRNRSRPAWDKMLAAIDAGEVDAVIVYHGDRLIRQPWDLEMLLSISREKGIRLASPSGTRNLDNPDDQFILRIEAAQACRESDNISRRVKRGIKARTAKGRAATPGGVRIFGFENDNETRREDECALLAEAAKRLLAGQKQTGVVRWLNTRSATTAGNPWYGRGLKGLLLAPRIAGLVQHDGVLREAVWQPVIPRETWEDLKALYEFRRDEYPYPGRERKYLLTGVAECGRCAATVRSQIVGQSGRNARLYTCPAEGCRGVGRNLAYVDAYVEGRALKLLNDPRFLEEVHSSSEGTGGVGTQIVELERRKAGARRQLENLADLPEIDAALVARSLASFDRKIAELRNRLVATAEQRLLRRVAGISREGWDAEPVDVRSAVIRALFRVVILPVTRRGPGFDPESVQISRRRVPGSSE